MPQKLNETKANTQIRVQYVILVRHGSRDKPYDKPRLMHRLENANYESRKVDDYHIADRSQTGQPASLSLAGWLAETMMLYDIQVSHVLYSSHKHAKETADAYLKALKPQKLCSDNLVSKVDSRLDVETFWKNISAHSDLQKDIIATPNNQALLICGHQPQLTWIANAFLKELRPLPLRQSEAACLKIGSRPQLLWVISDYHEKTISELKEKISSKMDVAKFFAGFISLLLGVTLKEVDWTTTTQNMPWVVFNYSGTVLVLLSLGLCIATMFAYDRLIMPSIFWSGKPRSINEQHPKWVARRPPSQTHWILYFNMVRIWDRLFTPAVVAFFTGLTTILIGVLKPPLSMTLIMPATLLITYWAYRTLRPELGFDD